MPAVISQEDILRLRAHRMLTDGRQHDMEALHWARLTLMFDAIDMPIRSQAKARAVENHIEAMYFTARELSLGAQRVWA